LTTKFITRQYKKKVADLKEEITAVVSNAKPERGDCVVLIMNSGGGTVNGKHNKFHI
jgi:urease accessory protein UreH